jgi:serine/threonine protein kinase
VTYILDFKKIELTRKIGEGAFGIVFLGNLNNTPVAVKQLHSQQMGDKELKEFIAEATTMKNIPPHPNLVLFRGMCLEPLCLITDYCDGGSLYSLLKSNQDIAEETKVKWVNDICNGMLHLHHGFDIQVIHRDLAARNILVSQTNVFDILWQFTLELTSLVV